MKHFFKILKITFLVLFVFITGTSFSQDGCGYDEALKEALKDTNFLKKYVKEQSLINQEVKKIQSSGEKTRNIITIPVVVHILYRKEDGDANLIYDRVKSQIDILNKHFNATDPVAIDNSHPYYKSDFAANCQFNFVLANKDPNGKPTTGIVRKRINSYLDDDLDYCNSATGGSTSWDTYKYLNIYVLPKLKDNNLGVYYPSIPGTLQDVVFVKASCFGEGSEDPNNSFGSTCSHEVGHWLSLEHIFGMEDNANTFCSRDLINDTPPQINNSYNISVNGTQLQSDNCGTDLIINNLSGAQHLAFDDRYKRGLFGSSSGLGFFQSSPINNNSTIGEIAYNDNALNWNNGPLSGFLWYSCASCTTKTVRDIIRTKDGKYWIAMAANAAQATQGGIFSCNWDNDPGVAFPTQPSLDNTTITTGQDARYCRDLSSDANDNIYAAFSFYLSGTTQFDGKLGKYNKASGTWQFTTNGMAPIDPSGIIKTRNVINVHCDTLNNLVYATTQQAFISGTGYGPYLLVYNTNLGFIAKKDFVSLGNISFRGIVTDKLSRVWVVYTSGSSSVLKVYDNTFNELFEYPLSSLTNNNGLKYDMFDNLYIQTTSGLIVINKASMVNVAADIVEYVSTQYSTPSFFKENTYLINTNSTGLSWDNTGETIYWTDGIQVLRYRVPYRAYKGGRMYNNLMDYINPSNIQTIFTKGQNERMHATFDTKRLNLQTSDGYIAGGYCPSNQDLAKVGLARVTNLTCNAVRLRWDKNPCVDKYTLRYRKSIPQGQTQDPWIFNYNIPSNKTSYVLNPNNSSLAPNTAYEYQIISVKAGFSNISSDLGFFKTLSAPCRTEEEDNDDVLSVSENDMMIYPNPNSGKFNISYSFEDESDILVRIINMNGQVLYESNRPYDPFTNTIEINAELPAGYYIVSITNDNSSLNKGIIISR